MKLFQAGWNGELQEPGWLTALNQEAMSDIPGQKNEGSSISVPAMFSTDEREFPFEDIESLVFGMMHMQGRREARRQGLFDQAEGLSIVLAGRFEKHERAEKPDSLAQMTKQSMGALVDYVEERGYIERVSDPKDGRAWLIRLTPRGREVEQIARAAIGELETEWAQYLGNERFATLRSALQDLVTFVESKGEVGRLPR